MRSLLRMESKQTVSLRACLVSHVPVHDCLFVARSHLGRLRHSCSLLVFTWSSWEQREPHQWNRAAADRDQSWERSWTPTKRTSKYEQRDWQTPTGFKTTQGLPDNFVQSKSHLDSREIYGKTLLRKIAATSLRDWPDKAWNK